MEDPPTAERQINTPTKKEAINIPWWLSEESLLRKVELDYSVDSKTPIREVKETIKEELKNVIPIADDTTKPIPVTAIQKNKFGLIAKKEMTATHVSGQDLVTGGATPLEIVVGLFTRAETGPVDSKLEREMTVPPSRTQQKGLCSVQMIRLADETAPPVIERPG